MTAPPGDTVVVSTVDALGMECVGPGTLLKPPQCLGWFPIEMISSLSLSVNRGETLINLGKIRVHSLLTVDTRIKPDGQMV